MVILKEKLENNPVCNFVFRLFIKIDEKNPVPSNLLQTLI